MIFAALTIMAVALTCAMFATRQSLLGFPSAMSWFVLGVYCYTQSTVPWGDIYYYMFFMSSFGMTIFTALAAYGLREKRDSGTDEDEFIDERGGSSEDNKTVDETGDGGARDSGVQLSKHTVAIRDRAKRRKTGFFPRVKKNPWGEFK